MSNALAYLHDLQLIGGSAMKPEVAFSEKSEYKGTNLRKIRAGCIIRRAWHDGSQRYLLGRIVDGKSNKAGFLKSPGGYLKLLPDRNGTVDRTSSGGLQRELREEGLRGMFNVKPDSIVPLGVLSHPDKGVLQFYSADLEQYPTMGVTKEVAFRKRIAGPVNIRWVSFDMLMHNTFEQYGCTQPPKAKDETIEMFAASHLYNRSVPVYFPESESRFADGFGELDVPASIREQLLEQSGLDADIDSFMTSCSVHYAVPEMDQLLRCVRIFFSSDVFLHDEILFGADLERMVRDEGLTGPLSEIAPLLVKEYVKEHYERVISEDIAARCLVDR